MATQEQRGADSIWQGVGMRLKAARENVGLSQQEVGDRFGCPKAMVSAWEKGRGDPGVYRLMELADLYGIHADIILLEDSLTAAAMQMAVEFDSLSEKQRSTLRAIGLAFITDAKSDEYRGAILPPVPNHQSHEPAHAPRLALGFFHLRPSWRPDGGDFVNLPFVGHAAIGLPFFCPRVKYCLTTQSNVVRLPPCAELLGATQESNMFEVIWSYSQDKYMVRSVLVASTIKPKIIGTKDECAMWIAAQGETA